MSTLVHGNDFVAVGPDQHLDIIKATLSDKCKIKIEQLGQGESNIAEIRILNKVVHMTEVGIELEADPRHAELIIKELGLESARPSLVPGSKTEGKTSATADVARKRATQARIDVEGEIDSAQNTTKSTNGENWDSEFAGEMEIGTTDDGDTELNAEDARSYWAVAVRLNYIFPDRPDIG